MSKYLSQLLCATALAAVGTAHPESYVFDFQDDLATDIAEGAVAVSDLSSPVNATFGSETITLRASAANDLSSSRDRGELLGEKMKGANRDITRDFIQWRTKEPVVITISGLKRNHPYEFKLWSGDLVDGQIKTTDHTIAGASGGGTIRHTSVSLSDENTKGGSLVSFPNVTSTANGTLTYTIDYVTDGGIAATLNGFELTVVTDETTATVPATAGTTSSAAFMYDFGTDSSSVQSGYTGIHTNGSSGNANDGSSLAGSPNLSVSYPAGQTVHQRDRGTGQFSDLTNADILRDMIYLDGLSMSDDITFTVTGLTGNQEYEVFGYAVDMFSAGTNDNITVSWTTNGGAVQHTTDSANEDLSSARFQMANMTADASGEATISARMVSGDIMILNGFEILAAADTAPTWLVATIPANGAGNVPVSTNLVITFDESIAVGSGVVTIKNLTDATQATIDITDGSQISINDATLTIDPAFDLPKGKNYAVRIDGTAIVDTSGDALVGISDDATWNFTTVAPGFSEWIAEQSVGGLTGPVDDYDGDDIPNIVENYFGTNPAEPSRGLEPGTTAVIGGNTTFTFTHPLNPLPADNTGASYRWSKDGVDFQDSGVAFEGSIVTFSEPGSPDAEGIVTVTATVTGNPIEQVFVLVQVTEN